MFNLSEQLKKLKEDLSSSLGSHSLIKFTVDDKLPKNLEGDPNQIITVIRHFSTAIFQGIANGVLRVEANLKEKKGKQIIANIRIIGVGLVEKEAKKVEAELERLSKLQHLEELSVIKDAKQIAVHFSTSLQLGENHGPDDLHAFSGKNVLIVEDSDINTFVFASFLEYWGVHYSTVYDGLAGVDFAMAREYDAIFMDIHMPIMNGIEAIKLIRKKNKEIPIIVISGVSDMVSIDDAIKVGASDFVRKPASKKDLYDVLSKYF
jgi:CheY-like chemotaxis protein